MKLALEAAYLAGFSASGEGYNGEYPFGDKNQNPEHDSVWCKDRDNALQEALANHCEDNLNMVKQEQGQTNRPIESDYISQVAYTRALEAYCDEQKQDMPKIGCVNHDCDKCKEQGEPDYWLGYGLQAHTEKPFEGATPLYTTPQQRKPLTDADYVNACMSYRHDFGLMTQEQRDKLLFTAKEWARAFGMNEAAHGIKENT